MKSEATAYVVSPIRLFKMKEQSITTECTKKGEAKKEGKEQEQRRKERRHRGNNLTLNVLFSDRYR